jgi:hypothetical protein
LKCSRYYRKIRTTNSRGVYKKVEKLVGDWEITVRVLRGKYSWVCGGGGGEKEEKEEEKEEEEGEEE